MKIKREPTRLEKKARRGDRGFPVATVAFYGPNASRASKVAVGIILKEGEETHDLERWFSESTDVRRDPKIGKKIVEYINRFNVKSVVMADRIIGCPHEEVVDYPEGEVCPVCPYWADRDRWSGEKLPTQ
jgi:hypothetical protein